MFAQQEAFTFDALAQFARLIGDGPGDYALYYADDILKMWIAEEEILIYIYMLKDVMVNNIEIS